MLNGQGDGAIRSAPHNLDAEQALLGAILVDNEAFWRVSDNLSEDHFFDPLHQRIFAALAGMIRRGRLATPVTIKSFFDGDEALEAAGGNEYLVKLASNAPTIMNAPEYARTVFELFQRRGLMHLGEDMVNTASSADVEQSPSQQIERAEQQLYELAERAKYEGGFQPFAFAARQARESAHAAYQRDGHLAGLASGLIDLDRMLGGLHKSDLIILAGRPSMGKTALATNIAFNVARRHRAERQVDGTTKTVEGGVVGFFSLEMSGVQLAMRLLAETTGIPTTRLRKGEFDLQQFEDLVSAEKTLETIPLHIDDTGGLSLAALAARARRLQRQKGLDLIVVDYLQLVTTSGLRRNDGRVQEVSEVTQGLKALAKELDIPVIALSQLSRKVEDRDDKRPQLADLRESGSIEQDADVVMFVYREEYYVERTKPGDDELEKMIKWKDKMEAVHGLAEVIIGKQRNGPTGSVSLQFDGNLTRFSNRSRRDEPDLPV